MTSDMCRHLATEDLGRQGDTSYERCIACGRILITQHGQSWILRPRMPAA